MFMMKKKFALFLISFVLVFAWAQPVCAEEREWLILIYVSGNNERVRGLAIYLPDWIYDASAYEPLAFASDSQWRSFLMAVLKEKLKK